MRILSLTVARNEEHRYLARMLAVLRLAVDTTFLYDDCSTDGTIGVALDAGVDVAHTRRGCSFLEHEGRFRQGAWDAFQALMQPEPGDWVLSVDADEFLVGDDPCGRLRRLVNEADGQGACSVRLRIPEVFGVDDDGCPLVRTDGFWGTIAGMRFFRYLPNGRFFDKPMGCGSEPTYVEQQRIMSGPGDLALLHYGYAVQADRAAKFQRYSALAQHGHNDAHIESILGPQTLARWDGPWPRP